MPYKTNNDLPESVKDHLPKHAQDIYREAFNHAHEEYNDKEKRQDSSESREETSHRVAWSAVKKKYEKKYDGKWHPKDH